MVGIEGDLFLDAVAHPLLPIKVLRRAPRLDVVIPFAFRVVAHVGVLPHDQRPDFAGLDQFGRFMPARVRANLRANLENAPRLFHCIVHLKCFLQIAGHRLLAIDMLAGFHRSNGARRMPVVDRRNCDRVDIFIFKELAVIIVALDAAADVLLGVSDAGLGHITNGDLLDVVIRAIFFLAANVGRALAANADIADENAIIGADHLSRGRSGALAVNRGFENVAGCNNGGSGGGGFDELAARSHAGGGFFVFILHKFSWLLMLDKN